MRSLEFNSKDKIFCELFPDILEVTISVVIIKSPPIKIISDFQGQVHNAESAEQDSSARLSSALFTGLLGNSP